MKATRKARGDRSGSGRGAAPRASGWGGRTFDAFPDRIDIRDWLYRPALVSLPDTMVNCPRVPKILDQGKDGACTGFALAAVINFLLHGRAVRRTVSAYMLYHMARRYDEWPGEDYEGSSARGAMKGWIAHGVCREDTWKGRAKVADLGPELAREAEGTPGGAYYRVTHREIRDMHAALGEVGVLYATLMVHRGWIEPDGRPEKVPYSHGGRQHRIRLPTIRRVGQAENGHAVAIVGYTSNGFIVQNSWGSAWGSGGFALLPYEDYMLHATDVWVAQLGVPIELNLWQAAKGDDTSGIARAARAVPLNAIRPYVIDVGNNGELSRSGEYWTTTDDLERLFAEAIPAAAKPWSKRRVLLYLHGGLNKESEVAKRIVAFRDVLLANQIYPVHIMWETGVMESLRDMLKDVFTEVEDRAGAAWIEKFREGLIEAKDRTFEITTAAMGGALWREMKENARLISKHPAGLGALELTAKYAQEALRPLAAAERARWELHVVGHSAGSIVAAYAMKTLCDLGPSVATVQFMAPAVTVELFREEMAPLVRERRCPHPTLYILSDAAERGDQVGAYGKSLLYLVSNAFENRRGTSILGMEKFISDRGDGPHADVDPEMNDLFGRPVDGRPSLVVAGEPAKPGQPDPSRSCSKTHGGFDNDEYTLNSILYRILGRAPDHPFVARDLSY